MTQPSNEEVLRELQNVDDWEFLIAKMTAYAVHLAKVEYRWQPGTILPKGNDVKDVVFSTVKKAFTGERTWNPQDVPLEVWLRNNIRSEMNNLFQSAFTSDEQLREVPIDSSDSENDRRELTGAVIGNFKQETGNPEERLLEKEERIEREHLREALYEAIEGDELLEEIYLLILEISDRRPRVLAERLDVPRQEIYNALRRLDRRVEQIVDERQVKSDG